MKKKNQKVILAIHGMTMLGSKDPKFINICMNLSGSGYTVIAPQIDTMQNLKIELSDITSIVDMINIITNDDGLCPDRTISIFAASFAGGVSLIASSDAAISEKISSICLIGSFGNIENSIHYLLKNQECDNYGRLIILKNFLPYSIDVPDKVNRAIEIALNDNFLKMKSRIYPLISADYH